MSRNSLPLPVGCSLLPFQPFLTFPLDVQTPSPARTVSNRSTHLGSSFLPRPSRPSRCYHITTTEASASPFAPQLFWGRRILYIEREHSRSCAKPHHYLHCKEQSLGVVVCHLRGGRPCVTTSRLFSQQFSSSLKKKLPITLIYTEVMQHDLQVHPPPYRTSSGPVRFCSENNITKHKKVVCEAQKVFSWFCAAQNPAAEPARLWLTCSLPPPGCPSLAFLTQGAVQNEMQELAG